MKIELSEYEDVSVDISIAKLDVEYYLEKFGCESEDYARSVEKHGELIIKLGTLQKPPLIPKRYRKGLIVYFIIISSITVFSWVVSSHYGVVKKTHYHEVVLQNGDVINKEYSYYIDEWFGATHYTRISRIGKSSGQYDKFDRFFDLWFKLICIFIAINFAFHILRTNRVDDQNEEPLLKGMIPLLKESFVNDFNNAKQGILNRFSKK